MCVGGGGTWQVGGGEGRDNIESFAISQRSRVPDS